MRGAASDQALGELLESLTDPFLALWIEHSRTLQVSAVEALRTDEQWQELRQFILNYGRDLFHAKFMTLGNLRGILHGGVNPYLDYLRDNPDPLHPVRLLDDLGTAIPREQAVHYLGFVLHALVENYEEYKDYNTTTTYSDYGENLHRLFDFLHRKASYERQAWEFRPIVLAHEILARKGRSGAAVLWQEAFTDMTEEAADQELEQLAQLEQEHSMRLRTVTDRLQERFVKPLALDRLVALIEPAMAEARQPGERPSFTRLEKELAEYTASPTGVGLDVPHWLRRLEAEVRRVAMTRGTLAMLAEDTLQIPQRLLSREEMQRLLEGWENPPGPAAQNP